MCAHSTPHTVLMVFYGFLSFYRLVVSLSSILISDKCYDLHYCVIDRYWCCCSYCRLFLATVLIRLYISFRVLKTKHSGGVRMTVFVCMREGEREETVETSRSWYTLLQ